MASIFTPSTGEAYEAELAYAEAQRNAPGVTGTVDDSPPPQVTLTASERFVGAFGTAAHTIVGATVSNGASGPVNLVVHGQDTRFETGGTAYSVVTAEDAATSTIVHSNANGVLVAFTGAGSNTLVGSAGANDFTTAAGGTNAVVLA